jgi:hypothetical protein
MTMKNYISQLKYWSISLDVSCSYFQMRKNFAILRFQRADTYGNAIKEHYKLNEDDFTSTSF